MWEEYPISGQPGRTVFIDLMIVTTVYPVTGQNNQFQIYGPNLNATIIADREDLLKKLRQVSKLKRAYTI